MFLRRVLFFIPVLLFLILVGFFVHRLTMIEHGDAPNEIPSVMLNKPAPDFSLPSIFEGKTGLSSADLKGHVTLVDVFASWCVACRAEHALLFDVKKAGVALVGLNYKDKPEDARAWLGKLGNPYDVIGSDRDGHVAIDLGVYGVPESYLIDKNGVIRFKQTGVLTEAVVQKTLLPLIRELER